MALSDERMAELNQVLHDNVRIKLKLSHKNFKRLKVFHTEHQIILKKLIADYYSELLLSGIKPESDEAVEVFDRYEKLWRAAMREKVTKLGLHSKEGRADVLELFTEHVSKLLEDISATKGVEETPLESNTVGELVKLAEEHGALNLDGILVGCTNYKEMIEVLKGVIPKGRKLKFLTAAKVLVKETPEKT